MAAKKKGARRAKGGRSTKKGTPSVMQFLEKLGGAPESPRMRSTPAKGLLGEIKREDLVRAGRIDEDSREGPPAAMRRGPVDDLDEVHVEVSAEGGGEARDTDRAEWREQVSVRSVLGAEAAGGADAHAGNLSARGIFVETTRILEVGDPVLLSFPTGEGQQMNVGGRVRWVSPFGGVDDARPGMGIEFVGLDERRVQRLQALLARLPRRTA